MIRGTVNAYREPVITIHVLDGEGRVHCVEAVVDTGFNGSLTLPPTIIKELQLPWRSRSRVVLANGMEEECDVYSAKVQLGNQLRSILVESADTEPLSGMRLFTGHRITIDDIDGGEVTIEPI